MLTGIEFLISALLMTACTISLGSVSVFIAWAKIHSAWKAAGSRKLPSTLLPLAVAVCLSAASLPILSESYPGYGRSQRHLSIFFTLYVLFLMASFLLIVVSAVLPCSHEVPGAKAARFGAILALLIDSPFLIGVVVSLHSLHWKLLR
jgi:hypothetical protein